MLKGARLLRSFVTSRPVLCNWQITYRCDFACQICTFWREKHRSEDELTVAQVRVVADKLRPLAPLIISMAGGEPLIREDLPEIARILSRDHYYSIITNGWYATRDVARRLYEAGMGDVHVSLDYATPERHDAQRGRVGAFHRAIEALRIFRDARPDRWHRVRILAVLLDDNVTELEGLLEIAEELGVSVALSLYSDRLGQKPRRLPPPAVSDYLRELGRRHPGLLDSATPYLARFDQAIRDDGVAACKAGLTFIDIDERGRLSRCIDRNDQPAGDLRVDPLDRVLAELCRQAEDDPCGRCWTSCRGLAEVLTGPRGALSLGEMVRGVRPR